MRLEGLCCMWKELIWLYFKCEMPFSYQARMKDKKMHQERERVCCTAYLNIEIGKY